MEGFTHFREHLIGRLGGPITFRLIVQPIIAIILAIRDGLKDAKAGHPLYFYSLLTHSTERQRLLKDGWKSVGLVFVLAIVIDGVYQVIVFRRFYPGEALHVAIVLAIVPYLLIRGLANRIARHNIKSNGRESNPVVTLSMRVGSAIRWLKNGRETS
jgi:hypothetical protein